MSTILNSVFGLGDEAALRRRPGFRALTAGSDESIAWAGFRELAHMLKGYYLNNGLYDEVSRLLFEVNTWEEDIRPLRNPAYRAVEFYTAHLWPGVMPEAMPIETDNPKLEAALELVWRWSQWSSKKQLAARQFALYGELVLRASQSQDGQRVYMRPIEPLLVTDYDRDDRGNLARIRLDVPKQDANGNPTTHTEIWTPLEYRQWIHKGDHNTPETRLGEPAIRTNLLETYGIDFVPFTVAHFIDIGDKRGVGAFMLALDKIDELNRIATRLAQQMWNYGDVTHVVKSNTVDANNRPLPAPRLGAAQAEPGETNTVKVGKNRILYLPGMADLEQLVPQLPYEAMLKIVNEQALEIERDLPELAYWRLRDRGGDLSGIAIRNLLRDAEARALEARGSGEDAIIRAQQMCLTLGQLRKLKGFEGLGEFDSGALDHSFTKRDVFPLTVKEQWEIVKQMVDAGVPLEIALDEGAGWSEDKIEAVTDAQAAAEEKAQASLAQALLAAERRTAAGDGQGATRPANGNGQRPLNGQPAGAGAQGQAA